MSLSNPHKPIAVSRTGGIPRGIPTQRGKGVPTSQNAVKKESVQPQATPKSFDEDDYTVGSSYKNYDTDTRIAGDKYVKMLDSASRRAQSTQAGIARYRFITTDMLLELPADFFNKYQMPIKNISEVVRDNLVRTNQSDKVQKAEQNPTNENLQGEAFYAVSSLAYDAIGQGWVGIDRDIIVSGVCNEIMGFGVLDPLWRDETVTEIICNGPFDVQIERNGSLIKVPSLKFNSREHMYELLNRLYRSIGKTISQTTPRSKGRLYDKSRMFVTHDSIAPDGPNFNIRRHPKGFWTPEALVGKGTASPELMTFIGNLIYKGASCFVVGGTSSGKTSLLNALTGFYKPHARIITMEDNIEMKPNPKKYLASAMECHDPNSEGVGQTTMRDLVHASMQMRPDVIIVGEVTDPSAYDLCQALNTGHAGMSTFHANSSDLSITRVCSLVAQSGLTTIEGATDLVSAAFDFMINVRRLPDGSRKIVSVDEVGTSPIEVNGRITLGTKPLWRFVDEGFKDGKVMGHWEQVNDISSERKRNKLLDLEKDLSWDELRVLSDVPKDFEV